MGVRNNARTPKDARPQEKRLGDILSTLGIGYIHQAPFLFHNNGTKKIYFADYYCPELGVIFEADGPAHYTQEGLEYDSKRGDLFQSIGIKTVRVANDAISRISIKKEIGGVCTETHKASQGCAVLYLGVLSLPKLSVSDRIVLSYYIQFSGDRDALQASKIAGHTNISRRQVQDSIARLRGVGYIGDNKANVSLDNRCYFKLRTETGLTGLPLIVYSYIHFKSTKYKVVDKYHAAIASELRMSRSHLEQILTILRDGRHIIVKERKRQRLLRPTHGTD